MRFLILLLTASTLGTLTPRQASTSGAAAGNAQATPVGNAGNGKKIFASYGC